MLYINIFYEKYRVEEINVKYIKIDKQLADLFMKALSKKKFQFVISE